MASRDHRDQGRTLKILSREDRDRDGERGRDDRGDRDRDRRRRDDRDRERRREERDRRRDREREAEKPVQGPIVLLKRPDTKSGSGVSAGDRGDQGNSGNSASEASGTKNAPTLILQRSAKKDQENSDQSNVEKGKSSGPACVTDVLKPPYHFPGGKAMPLIDSSMKMCSWKSFNYDANNYPGNMDYLVVTVIGRPNVGKSTILSYLAGSEKFGNRSVFPPRNRDEEMQSSIYISQDQIVFIEMSSVYNQSATSDLIPLVSQQGVLEVSNVTWNLRLVRWALSVSHVILVVSENVFEPNVFQLMNSAEIIHPMDSALGEGSYPEPIYICNKANLELLDNLDGAQGREFQKQFTSVIGRKPRISTNYHVLPHIKYDMEHERFDEFKRSIMEFNRYNRAPFAPDKDELAKLVQKHNIQDWYQNACRLWDDMNMSNYFSSYVKLLP
ncbi:unnamed protein product [Orchesella dallaii]|uniref:G domain-containing protein n=1 Tax=Orchesella dallaii TaxID=48710 RepID=A0ABP1S745_9HEXA